MNIRRLFEPLAAAINSLTADLEVRAAEARTGVSLIEAVAADKFETDLRALCGFSEGAADEVRGMALDLVKAGVTRQQLPTLIRRSVSGPIMTLYELDILRRQVERTINRIKDREGIDE